MTSRIIVVLTLLLTMLVLPGESTRAQSQEIPFTILVTDWNGDMDMIEQLVRSTDFSNDASTTVRETLSKIVAEATARRNRAEERLTDLNARLTTLGPAPDRSYDAPEPRQVATERARLNDQISQAHSEQALAELAITRATALDGRIGAAQRVQLVGQLAEQGPTPIAAGSFTGIPGVVSAFFTGVAEAAGKWWDGLTDDMRGGMGLVQPSLILTIGLILAWWVRRRILHLVANRTSDAQPPYSKRLVSAIAEGVAKGIMPAALLGLFIFRAHSPGPIIHGDFGVILGLAAESMMIFVLVTALPHAVLAPPDPTWQLTRLKPENGRRILALLAPLALLFCVDLFATRVSAPDGPLAGIVTPEFNAIWTFGFCLAQGVLALSLLRPSLWVSVPQEAAEEDGEEPHQAEPVDAEGNPVRVSTSHPFRWAFLTLLVIMTIVGMIAPAFGYTNLGNYLLNNILGTAIVVAILVLLRGLFREAIGLALGSELIKDRLSFSHKIRNRLKLTARLLLDISILFAGLFIIAPIWSVPEADLLRILRVIFGGLQVGSVTVSPTDIVLSVVVFIVALSLVGALKTNLAEKILPETEIEESLRHTITAGIGYVGFIVAVGLAIAVAGVDLTNIALIAGALSVGIGFGLQNIVNNFVSGLILLIERPIKVGDWVVVGPNEGFVKQINMRATEIETWHKASVIVPNSDLLSSALKNWTHKDKIGRVDIKVGVALDSDIDKVCDILMELAQAHPRFRPLPEPVVLVTNIGDSRIDLELRLFTSDILWVMWISSDIKKEILRRFPKEGIKIPFPQHVLHMAEEGTKTPQLGVTEAGQSS